MFQHLGVNMNVMKLFHKVFGIKPMTMQQGLNSVKKKMGACGDNLSKKAGERIYKTPEGDRVVIRTTKSGLTVDRIIDKNNLKNNYDNYIGRTVGIKTERLNTQINDIWKRFQSLITVSIVSPKNKPLTDKILMPGETIVQKFHDGSVRESTKLFRKSIYTDVRTGMSVR